ADATKDERTKEYNALTILDSRFRGNDSSVQRGSRSFQTNDEPLCGAPVVLSEEYQGVGAPTKRRKQGNRHPRESGGPGFYLEISGFPRPRDRRAVIAPMSKRYGDSTRLFGREGESDDSYFPDDLLETRRRVLWPLVGHA
ncbi:MAG: hypothetical protein AB1896_16220, partial [Thermodesulfobacteriota bacterium]